MNPRPQYLRHRWIHWAMPNYEHIHIDHGVTKHSLMNFPLYLPRSTAELDQLCPRWPRVSWRHKDERGPTQEWKIGLTKDQRRWHLQKAKGSEGQSRQDLLPRLWFHGQKQSLVSPWRVLQLRGGQKAQKHADDQQHFAHGESYNVRNRLKILLTFHDKFTLGCVRIATLAAAIAQWRPWVRIPSATSTLFSNYVIVVWIGMWKERKWTKRGWDWPS